MECKIKGNKNIETETGEMPKRLVVVLTTVLLVPIGIAFTTGINSLLEILAMEEISWSLFILPTVYFITLIRFVIGNICHIVRTEKVGKKGEWILDLLIIMSEFIIFAIMGKFSYRNTQFFIALLGILLYVDIIWVIYMNRAFLRKKRLTKPPEIEWALINIISTAILLLLSYNIPVPILSFEGLVCLLCMFITAAILDVIHTLKMNSNELKN